MQQPLRVHVLTLTQQGEASEHVYAGELKSAFRDHGIQFVDSPAEADVVHLFEVNFFTRHALRTFQYPHLVRLLYSATPVVVSTDDLYFIDRPDLTARPRLYPINHYTQRWLLGRAGAVIAISESVRGGLRPHLPGQKIEVVHHGVDDRYRIDSVMNRDPFVLHVSLAAPRKNPEAVIETARRLDVPVRIAGSGWDERIPDTPAFSNVEILGYVPEEELIDLYHSAAVFYFPTFHEGFGLPVLEAMAAGCAVVTSDVYSIPEVAGDAAVLHDPHDVDAHVATIERLLNDGDERRTLAQRARDRAADFTWAESARKTREVYESVLDDG